MQLTNRLEIWDIKVLSWKEETNFISGQTKFGLALALYVKTESHFFVRQLFIHGHPVSILVPALSTPVTPVGSFIFNQLKTNKH